MAYDIYDASIPPLVHMLGGPARDALREGSL